MIPGLLASVRNAAEAEAAIAGGADIVDLKEPAAGALGRLPDDTVRACLATVARRVPVSATICDLPLHDSARVAAAADAVAALGVDIVKVGLFAGALAPALAALSPLAARRPVVLVAFADRAPDLAAAAPLTTAAGLRGIMLDTADKAAGPLTRHMGAGALAAFVALARRHGLLCGLAGSLRAADVPLLAPLGADYLGFRSALTVGGRADALDPARVAALRQALVSSSASAAAGAASAARSATAGSSAGSIAARLR
jgi:(5-formylfuran-3-yl)methyl phosphate synthase